MNRFLKFIFLLSQICNAQDITVSNKKFSTLIFSNNIVSGLIGNEDYIFEFDKENPDNIALLKANSSQSNETSLIIKTEDGSIFNLNVKYDKDSKNIQIIHDSLGINYKKRKSDDIYVSSSLNISKPSNDKESIKTSVRENDYTIGNTTINDSENNSVNCDHCSKLLDKSKGIKRVSDTSYNITTQLYNLFYFDKKLYFILNIENTSNIDYNLNYIKSFIDIKEQSRSSSTQYLEKNPVSIFNSNRTIKANSNRKFVFVYEQFTVDKNKGLTFEINESNGERNLSLTIPAFIINNPISFKKIK